MNLLNNVKRGFSRSKVALLAAVAVPFAMTSQAAIDTTGAVGEITGAGTAIAAVGGGILVLAGISLAYRWTKASFF
jgi:hypothetical protein